MTGKSSYAVAMARLDAATGDGIARLEEAGDLGDLLLTHFAVQLDNAAGATAMADR